MRSCGTSLLKCWNSMRVMSTLCVCCMFVRAGRVSRCERVCRAAARFDPFAAEGLGVDFESTAWKPPTVEKALEERKVQLFGGMPSAPVALIARKHLDVDAACVFTCAVLTGGESSLWSTSSNDLIHLGVGVTLYFKILKSLVFAMLLGCLFFVPLLIIYSSGHRVPSSTPDPLRFSKISLGNIGCVNTFWRARRLSSAAACDVM